MLTSRTKEPARKKINKLTFSISRKRRRQLCQSVASRVLVSCENDLTHPPSPELKAGAVPWLGRWAGASVPTLVTPWPLVGPDAGGMEPSPQTMPKGGPTAPSPSVPCTVPGGHQLQTAHRVKDRNVNTSSSCHYDTKSPRSLGIHLQPTDCLYMFVGHLFMEANID